MVKRKKSSLSLAWPAMLSQRPGLRNKKEEVSSHGHALNSFFFVTSGFVREWEPEVEKGIACPGRWELTSEREEEKEKN